MSAAANAPLRAHHNLDTIYSLQAALRLYLHHLIDGRASVTNHDAEELLLDLKLIHADRLQAVLRLPEVKLLK